MSLDIQTNIAALIAQNNLNTNQNFMTQTITRLTSGYRINSSADDAAGLVVANEYRSNVTELTQGVLNANDGVSSLQIIDGGLSNISTMLDRMKTLATESASGTFQGNRATLDQEYQGLVGEINREAANIGLNAGGTNNNVLNVYIGGGGNVQANSQVSVDLSGAASQVDAAGLGLDGTTLLAPGSTFGTVDLNTAQTLLAGGNGPNSQTLTFNLSGGQQVQATITSQTGAGISTTDAVAQLNSQLSSSGLAAYVNSTTGGLMISGSVAFTASAAAATDGTGLVNATDTSENNSLYTVDQNSTNKPTLAFAGMGAGTEETLDFTSAGNTVAVSLTPTNAGTPAAALQTLNGQLASLGISAVLGTGGDIEFQSATAFTVNKPEAAAGAGGDPGVFASSVGGAIPDTATAPTVTASTTSNALTAITALNDAVQALGNVQGTVGAGENRLNYAIGLANSQITSYSAAEAGIRDADMASEAANLTKAQILEQSTIAAMAQANSAPEAVLSLLSGH